MPIEVKNTAWTEDELAELLELSKTLTVKQIADKLCRTNEAVRWQLRKRGVHKELIGVRPRTEQQRIMLMVRRYGVQDAAKRLNMTKDQVHGVKRRYEANESLKRSSIPVERAEKIREQAIALACRKQRHEHSNDFASYCVLRLYENKESALEYMWIDYLSEYIANRKSDAYDIQLAEKLYYTEIKAPSGSEEEPDKAVDIPAHIDEQMRFFQLFQGIELETEERVIFLLHALYGLRLGEIAFCFDKDQSTMSILLANIREKIRKRSLKPL